MSAVIENVVMSALETYKRAVYDKNIDLFLSIYDENIDIFDMWGPEWTYKGIGAWRKMAEEWFGSLGSDRVVVDFEVLGMLKLPDIAFASIFVKYTGVSQEGKPLRFLENRMTCVFVRKGDEWKIVHEHTSAPVDGETLKASLQR